MTSPTAWASDVFQLAPCVTPIGKIVPPAPPAWDVSSTNEIGMPATARGPGRWCDNRPAERGTKSLTQARLVEESELHLPQVGDPAVGVVHRAAERLGAILGLRAIVGAGGRPDGRA